MAGVELCTCQTAGQQSDDDDRDEDDRLPIEESPAASLLASRRLRVGRRSRLGTGGWRRRRCCARRRRRRLRTARRWWWRLDTARRRWRWRWRWRPKFLGGCCVRRLPARTDLFGRWFRCPVRTLDPARCGVLVWVAPALPTGPPGTLRRRRRGHLRDSASSSRIHPVNLGQYRSTHVQRSLDHYRDRRSPTARAVRRVHDTHDGGDTPTATKPGCVRNRDNSARAVRKSCAREAVRPPS